MKIFADTANVNELRELDEMGLICGVTTNPTILSREGPDAINSLRQIRNLLFNYPILAQVVATDHKGMVEEGRMIKAVGPQLVVKIPATNEGIKAIATLKKENIRTCATAILTSAEALLCAAAGADYVAPYTGQNNIIGFDGLATVREIAAMLAIGKIKCQILAASIDKPQDIVDVAVAGAHIATLTYAQLIAVCDKPAPLTNYYVDNFLADWNKAGAYFRSIPVIDKTS